MTVTPIHGMSGSAPTGSSLNNEVCIFNLYQILKVNPKADERTIRAAYRTLMFKYRCHPDLGGSEEQARQINQAYEVLSDPEKRREYNLTLGPKAFGVKRDLDFVERRRIPRVRVDFNVLYKVEGSGFTPARLFDLSCLGCRLQTKDQVGMGTKVTVDIKGHIVEGAVRWKRMFHPSIFQRIHESGIEFSRDFDEIDQI